jgi:hypothetical protein
MKLLKSNIIGIWVVLIFLALLINMFIEDRNQKLLNDSKTVFGFLKYEDHASLKYSFGTFIFFVKNKKYEVKSIGDFSFLNQGDTVLITYAIKDPNVAKVTNRYYMRKYKKLKIN